MEQSASVRGVARRPDGPRLRRSPWSDRAVVTPRIAESSGPDERGLPNPSRRATRRPVELSSLYQLVQTGWPTLFPMAHVGWRGGGVYCGDPTEPTLSPAGRSRLSRTCARPVATERAAGSAS